MHRSSFLFLHGMVEVERAQIVDWIDAVVGSKKLLECGIHSCLVVESTDEQSHFQKETTD